MNKTASYFFIIAVLIWSKSSSLWYSDSENYNVKNLLAVRAYFSFLLSLVIVVISKQPVNDSRFKRCWHLNVHLVNKYFYSKLYKKLFKSVESCGVFHITCFLKDDIIKSRTYSDCGVPRRILHIYGNQSSFSGVIIIISVLLK